MKLEELTNGETKIASVEEQKATIKLLKIEPSESYYDLIECCFVETDLATSTIPYILDEPIEPPGVEKDHVILCSGSLLPISEYTHYFLRTLRDQKDERFHHVWSSRLCIDLTNPKEILRHQKLLALIQHKSLRKLSVIPVYRHKPLPGPDWIRVIELDPTPRGHGMLRTRIREVSLAEKPAYVYLDIRKELTEDSWPEKGTFLCNNRILSVSKLLYQALETLLPRVPQAFYIEAISMDSKNPEEMKNSNFRDQDIRQKASGMLGLKHPKFTYQPLPDSSPHIRLLRILPASNPYDVLVADIGHCPLDSAPEFVALSYVWGSPTPPYMICARDGRYVPCTSSLFVALCNLRQRGDLIVWADAVCINQEDNAEKSKQVMLMGDIYKRASRVVVDLGINCLNENHRPCRLFLPPLIKMLALTRKVLQAVRPEFSMLDPREYSKFGIPQYGHQAWSGWRAMRSTPWLTRSWIVQEVCAGKEVIVLYNGMIYNWKDLAAANQVTAKEQVDVGAYAGKMNMTNMNDLQQITLKKPPALLDVLTNFRSLDATDPRDKIYAFRGLASDGADSPLPDYSKGVEQIYLDYATYFVKQGRGLDLLADAGLSRSIKSLPSWVPDWSFNKSWQTFNFSKQSAWTSLKELQPNGDAKNCQIRIDEDNPKALQASTAILDEIVDVSFPVSNTFKYNDSLELAKRVDLEMMDLYTSAKKFSPAKEQSECEEHHARVRTILVGGDAGRFKPLTTFFETSKILGSKEPPTEHKEAVTTFDETLRERLSCRRFGLTKRGWLSLLPAISEKKDLVVWFKGATAPMVLREKDKGYVLIGDAFIDGLMGEERQSEVAKLGLGYQDLLLY